MSIGVVTGHELEQLAIALGAAPSDIRSVADILSENMAGGIFTVYVPAAAKVKMAPKSKAYGPARSRNARKVW